MSHDYSNELVKRPAGVPRLPDNSAVVRLTDQFRALFVELMRRGNHSFIIIYALVETAASLITDERERNADDEQWTRDFFRGYAETFNSWHRFLESMEPIPSKWSDEDEECLEREMDWGDEVKVTPLKLQFLALSFELLKAKEHRNTVASALMSVVVEQTKMESETDRRGQRWALGFLRDCEKFFSEWWANLSDAQEMVTEMQCRDRAGHMLQ